MTEEGNTDTSQYKNPMRFSLRDQRVNIQQYPIVVTEIEVRPGEGTIYVHWRPETVAECAECGAPLSAEEKVEASDGTYCDDCAYAGERGPYAP